MELTLTCFWQQQVAFSEVVPQLRIQSLCPNDLLQKYFSSVLTLGPALYLYNLVSVLGVSRSHLFFRWFRYFAKSGHG